MKNEISEYENRISLELARLGISLELILQKQLPLYLEAQELTAAEIAIDGRAYLMTPATALAWTAMKQAAAQESVVLEVVSAFRSIERQVEIIQAKLGRVDIY